MGKINGDGPGYGGGYGYGDGDGAGYGYGDGYGYGAGDGAYYRAILRQTTLALGREADGCCLGFWRSNDRGMPCNGGSGTVARIGLMEEIDGPLELCTPRALHATLNPKMWQGERLWIVALYPPYRQDGDKIGSLKREFLAEIPNFLV